MILTTRMYPLHSSSHTKKPEAKVDRRFIDQLAASIDVPRIAAIGKSMSALPALRSSFLPYLAIGSAAALPFWFMDVRNSKSVDSCFHRCRPALESLFLQNGLGANPLHAYGSAPQDFFGSLAEASAVRGLERTKLSRLDDAREQLLRPVVFEDVHGHIHHIIGSYREERENIYQVVHGMDGPYCVAASDLVADSIYKFAWVAPESFVWPPSVYWNIGDSQIEVVRSNWSFGHTKPFKKYATSVCIRHVYGGAIELIGEPLPSCTCTVAAINGDRRIEPGGHLDLDIVLATSNATSIRSDIVLRLKDASSGKTAAVRIPFYATQPATMEVVPAEIDFGRVEPGEVSVREVFLRETSDDRFAITGVRVRAEGIPLEVVLSTRRYEATLNEYCLRCELKAPQAQSLGRGSGRLQIKTTSHHREAVEIPISFHLAPLRDLVPTRDRRGGRGLISEGRTP